MNNKIIFKGLFFVSDETILYYSILCNEVVLLIEVLLINRYCP